MTDQPTSPASIADLIGQGRAVEALRAEIASIVATAFEPLRSPKLRGPFACPSEDDLTRAATLHALANWLRAAAKRSGRTLGPRRVREALEATRNLTLAADLLAMLEEAPNPETAQDMASAALKGLVLGNRLPRRRVGFSGFAIEAEGISV